uniref:Uncharacterized protein n=1 Tax=Rhizophora mucronata TaxID=61149 RepID=A0A2P2QRD1_RHIMU
MMDYGCMTAEGIERAAETA